MAVVAGVDGGRRAIDRGATILQLRAPELSARALEDQARELVAVSTVPVLVSARCDIALACRAAGVNMPERDLGVADARRLLGDRIVGRSVHSVEAARVAEREGADYVVFGPVWASPTHSQSAAQGLDALTAVVRAVRLPVLAIGGLTPERARACIEAGAGGYAAIRMFQ
jgi:thiamine-phosphate pyrophosphorylase